MPKILKDEFRAWIDKMPGAGPKLIVTGNVEVPTGGWNVTLKPAVPQGVNPAILILEIRAVPPSGNVTEVITQIKVRYEEAPPRQKYTQTTIRSDSSEFTIDVGTTS
jgi:hypothetical protein